MGPAYRCSEWCTRMVVMRSTGRLAQAQRPIAALEHPDSLRQHRLWCSQWPGRAQSACRLRRNAALLHTLDHGAAVRAHACEVARIHDDSVAVLLNVALHGASRGARTEAWRPARRRGPTTASDSSAEVRDLGVPTSSGKATCSLVSCNRFISQSATFAWLWLWLYSRP